MEIVYSIIIVNYNGGEKLRECVESIFEFTSNFELIVVDNGSTDDSISSVRKGFPAAIILQAGSNIGFAQANNLAIRGSHGQWIVLLNPDTKVTKLWIENMIRCGATSNDIGVVTPKLLRLDARTIDSTGHEFDFKTGYTRDRGAGEVDKGQYDSIEEVPSCCFACVAIKREAMVQIGLLDDKMFLYFEDVDFCIRARIAGWKVLYCPTSVVLHARSGVTPISAKRIQRSAVAYRLRIMLKCYSSRNAIKYGLGRALRDVQSSAAGLKNKDFEYFLGYFRSPFWNLFNLPIKERRQAQSTRKVSDLVLSTMR